MNTVSFSSVEETNQFYEDVGKDVLSSWDLELTPKSPPTDPLPIKRLYTYMATPIDQLRLGWEQDFQNILNSLSSVDYALHGRAISMFLMKVNTYKENSEHRKYQKMIKKAHIPEKYQKKKEVTLPKRTFPIWLPTIFDD